MKGGFPPPRFWETFPVRRSKLVAAGLAIVSVFCILSAVGKIQSLRMAERDSSPLVQLGREVDQAVREATDAMVSLFEDSHQQAVKDGKLQEWAAKCIEEIKKKPGTADFFAFLVTRTEERDLQSDLLYCLQEASGINFDAQLGIAQKRAVLKSNLVLLREKFNIDEYDITAK